MRHDLTEIVCIVDRSGSMSGLESDVIGGINTFIKDQSSVEGDANFTLILFDTEPKLVLDGVNIKEVVPLDQHSYNVGGMTAMNDAIALGINTIGAKLHKMREEDRPGKVIVSIMTDGQENASTGFSTDNIKDMINHQTEKYAWEFIFMAANIDVNVVSDQIGIRSQNRYSFNADSAGVDMAYSTLSMSTSLYRS